MNELQIFTNEQFGVIRCTIIDDETWFVGKDVSQALGYQNTVDALIKHVDEEDKRIIQRSQNATLEIDIPNRGLTLINESGLYSLILSSKLPTAKQFKRWVTNEVLPSIRKHGYYINTNRPTPYQQVKELTELGKFLTAEFGVAKGIALAASTQLIENHYGSNLDVIKKLIPPAEHEIGMLTPTLIGKELGIPARQVNKLLIEKGLQIKEGKEYRLTDEGKKYAEAMPFTNNGHSGYQIKWLPQICTILLENTIH